jgi:hypothetical protein
MRVEKENPKTTQIAANASSFEMTSIVVSIYLIYVACERGFYGPNCLYVCGHCAGDTTCDHVTGSCPSGYCEPGWKHTPDQKCNEGTPVSSHD